MLRSSWDNATKPDIGILALTEQNLLPRSRNQRPMANNINTTLGTYDTVEFTNTGIDEIANNPMDRTKYLDQYYSMERAGFGREYANYGSKPDPFKPERDLSHTGRFLQDISYEKRH